MHFQLSLKFGFGLFSGVCFLWVFFKSLCSGSHTDKLFYGWIVLLDKSFPNLDI